MLPNQEGVLATAEFPHDMVALLRCSNDGGELRLAGECLSGDHGIIQGRLRCTRCGEEYKITDGIARLMVENLTDEDRHEIEWRNREEFYVKPYQPPAYGWRSELSDLLEIPPHLAALAPLDGTRVLEFACGDGRLTMLMAAMGARVLAVDFCPNGLKQMAARLPSGLAPTNYRCGGPLEGQDLRGLIGLVQADVAHFHVAPRAFHRALSSSPLDTHDQRVVMYRTTVNALLEDGKFVFGVEYDDLMRRILGLPLARRYSEGGIYIEHFELDQMRRELTPYFGKLRVQLVRQHVPMVRRLPLAMAVRICRMVGMMPLVRHLAELVLLTASQPLRPPVEGQSRSGNPVAKWIFRWYTRRLGKEPVWGTDERI